MSSIVLVGMALCALSLSEYIGFEVMASCAVCLCDYTGLVVMASFAVCLCVLMYRICSVVCLP